MLCFFVPETYGKEVVFHFLAYCCQHLYFPKISKLESIGIFRQTRTIVGHVIAQHKVRLWPSVCLLCLKKSKTVYVDCLEVFIISCTIRFSHSIFHLHGGVNTASTSETLTKVNRLPYLEWYESLCRKWIRFMHPLDFWFYTLNYSCKAQTDITAIRSSLRKVV